MNLKRKNQTKKQNVPYFPVDLATRFFTFIMKGKFGFWGKKSYLKLPATINNPQSIRVGSGVFIREHAWLNVTSHNKKHPTFTIGDGTYIGRFVHINAYRKVIIGSNVLIADRVFITDVDHGYKKRHIPIMLQDVEAKDPVILGEGCFIGIGAVILGGVRIGKNAVVGANAVVTKDVPDYSIVGGVPAKIIRTIK